MGAALRFPDVQRPYFDPDSILSFTQMPDPIWTDRNVSDLAVRVHGFLVCWLRSHPGRFPLTQEVASALDRAECTIRRAIRALSTAGYLILGKRRAQSRYDARMGYELKSPRPKLSSPTNPDPQRRLFPDDQDERADVRAQVCSSDRSGAQMCAHSEPPPHPPNRSEREKTDRLASTRADVRPSVLSLPEKTHEAEVTDEEHRGEVASRASGLLEGATAAAVGAAIDRFGLLGVDRALDVAEERKPPAGHWRFVVAVLENWERESKLPATASSPQNYNPPTPIKPLTRADITDLPTTIEQARGVGPVARLAIGLIRGWLAIGLLGDDEVPVDLREGEGRPGARSANSPPGRMEVQTR